MNIIYDIIFTRLDIKNYILFKIMQELFEKKPWVQPLAIAGSHLETEEKENIKENISEKGN